MVPAAVVAATLLAGGVANSAPPGRTLQAAEAVAPTATTATLTASPVSPVAHGTPVTLTATVSPATAVGTVQFKDGATNIGGPVMVSNGTASESTSTLVSGSRSLTAVFTPSNPAAFGTSTSPMVTFAVVGATDTNTTLTTSPASQVAQRTPVTLTATVSPATAVGTVQFKDGATNIGGPVMVSNGTASGSTATLAVGSHQLAAVFTPTTPAAFSPSMSSAVPLTVTGSGIGSSQSVLSLDVGVSVLDDRVPAAGGGPSALDAVTPVSGERGLVDARLSVLAGQGVLNAVVLLGQR